MPAARQYAPQYGGHCASAVYKNYTADTDPQAWKIVEGKRYLNYNKDIQERWEQGVTQRSEQANKNWPGRAQVDAWLSAVRGTRARRYGRRPRR